jgi:hypothetical protein
MNNFIPADQTSLFLFVTFAIVMFLIINFAVYKTNYKYKKFLGVFLIYLAAFAAIVKSGIIAEHFLPVVPLMGVTTLTLVVLFVKSEYGLRISTIFPLSVLIGFQLFRLPLELILHHWAEIGTVPQTMTWTGQNWDIIGGVVSLVAIPFVNKSKAFAWTAQMIGFVLLLNVARVVLMSSPVPFGWHLENPILLVEYLPYALILPLFVAAALAGHLITFRALTKK